MSIKMFRLFSFILLYIQNALQYLIEGNQKFNRIQATIYIIANKLCNDLIRPLILPLAASSARPNTP